MLSQTGQKGITKRKKYLKFLFQFRDCFSRSRPFAIFTATVPGVFMAFDDVGINSIVRVLFSDPNACNVINHFFSSSACDIAEICRNIPTFWRIADNYADFSRFFCFLFPNLGFGYPLKPPDLINKKAGKESEQVFPIPPGLIFLD